MFVLSTCGTSFLNTLGLLIIIVFKSGLRGTVWFGWWSGRPMYRGFVLAAVALGSSPGQGPFDACHSPSLSTCFPVIS